MRGGLGGKTRGENHSWKLEIRHITNVNVAAEGRRIHLGVVTWAVRGVLGPASSCEPPTQASCMALTSPNTRSSASTMVSGTGLVTTYWRGLSRTWGGGRIGLGLRV